MSKLEKLIRDNKQYKEAEAILKLLKEKGIFSIIEEKIKS